MVDYTEKPAQPSSSVIRSVEFELKSNGTGMVKYIVMEGQRTSNVTRGQV